MARRQNFKRTLCALALLTPGALSHMQMEEPSPLRDPHSNRTSEPKDYNILTPLHADGSDFACKLYQWNTPLTTVATYRAGGTYPLRLKGGATHGGGSCQVSLSCDYKTFNVIKSMEGDCPIEKEYEFTIPEDVPTQEKCLLAWTWFNKIGNREMYMNCAVVDLIGARGSGRSSRKISGNAASAKSASSAALAQAALSRLPEIYVANLKSVNDCVTKETTDVVFDNPGSDVVYGDGLSASSSRIKRRGGACTGVGRTTSDSSSSESSNSGSSSGSSSSSDSGSSSSSSDSGSSSSSSGSTGGDDGMWHPDKVNSGSSSSSGDSGSSWSSSNSGSSSSSGNSGSGSSSGGSTGGDDGMWHPDKVNSGSSGGDDGMWHPDKVNSGSWSSSGSTDGNKGQSQPMTVSSDSTSGSNSDTASFSSKKTPNTEVEEELAAYLKGLGNDDTSPEVDDTQRSSSANVFQYGFDRGSDSSFRMQQIHTREPPSDRKTSLDSPDYDFINHSAGKYLDKQSHPWDDDYYSDDDGELPGYLKKLIGGLHDDDYYYDSDYDGYEGEDYGGTYDRRKKTKKKHSSSQGSGKSKHSKTSSGDVSEETGAPSGESAPSKDSEFEASATEDVAAKPTADVKAKAGAEASATGSESHGEAEVSSTPTADVKSHGEEEAATTPIAESKSPSAEEASASSTAEAKSHAEEVTTTPSAESKSESDEGSSATSADVKTKSEGEATATSSIESSESSATSASGFGPFGKATDVISITINGTLSVFSFPDITASPTEFPTNFPFVLVDSASTSSEYSSTSSEAVISLDEPSVGLPSPASTDSASASKESAPAASESVPAPAPAAPGVVAPGGACSPGQFLCNGEKQFWVCGQFGGSEWTYGALRDVGGGLVCKDGKINRRSLDSHSVRKRGFGWYMGQDDSDWGSDDTDNPLDPIIDAIDTLISTTPRLATNKKGSSDGWNPSFDHKNDDEWYQPYTLAKRKLGWWISSSLPSNDVPSNPLVTITDKLKKLQDTLDWTISDLSSFKDKSKPQKRNSGWWLTYGGDDEDSKGKGYSSSDNSKHSSDPLDEILWKVNDLSAKFDKLRSLAGGDKWKRGWGFFGQYGKDDVNKAVAKGQMSDPFEPILTKLRSYIRLVRNLLPSDKAHVRPHAGGYQTQSPRYPWDKYGSSGWYKKRQSDFGGAGDGVSDPGDFADFGDDFGGDGVDSDDDADADQDQDEDEFEDDSFDGPSAPPPDGPDSIFDTPPSGPSGPFGAPSSGSRRPPRPNGPGNNIIALPKDLPEDEDEPLGRDGESKVPVPTQPKGGNRTSSRPPPSQQDSRPPPSQQKSRPSPSKQKSRPAQVRVGADSDGPSPDDEVPSAFAKPGSHINNPFAPGGELARPGDDPDDADLANIPELKRALRKRQDYGDNVQVPGFIYSDGSDGGNGIDGVADAAEELFGKEQDQTTPPDTGDDSKSAPSAASKPSAVSKPSAAAQQKPASTSQDSSKDTSKDNSDDADEDNDDEADDSADEEEDDGDADEEDDDSSNSTARRTKRDDLPPAPAGFKFSDGSDGGDGIDSDPTGLFGSEPANYQRLWGVADEAQDQAPTLSTGLAKPDDLPPAPADFKFSDGSNGGDGVDADPVDLFGSEPANYQKDWGVSPQAQEQPSAQSSHRTKRNDLPPAPAGFTFSDGSNGGDGIDDAPIELFGSEPVNYQRLWGVADEAQDQPQIVKSRAKRSTLLPAGFAVSDGSNGGDGIDDDPVALFGGEPADYERLWGVADEAQNQQQAPSDGSNGGDGVNDDPTALFGSEPVDYNAKWGVSDEAQAAKPRVKRSKLLPAGFAFSDGSNGGDGVDADPNALFGSEPADYQANWGVSDEAQVGNARVKRSTLLPAGFTFSDGSNGGDGIDEDPTTLFGSEPADYNAKWGVSDQVENETVDQQAEPQRELSSANNPPLPLPESIKGVKIFSSERLKHIRRPSRLEVDSPERYDWGEKKKRQAAAPDSTDTAPQPSVPVNIVPDDPNTQEPAGFTFSDGAKGGDGIDADPTALFGDEPDDYDQKWGVDEKAVQNQTAVTQLEDAEEAALPSKAATKKTAQKQATQAGAQRQQLPAPIGKLTASNLLPRPGADADSEISVSIDLPPLPAPTGSKLPLGLPLLKAKPTPRPALPLGGELDAEVIAPIGGVGKAQSNLLPSLKANAKPVPVPAEEDASSTSIAPIDALDEPQPSFLPTVKGKAKPAPGFFDSVSGDPAPLKQANAIPSEVPEAESITGPIGKARPSGPLGKASSSALLGAAKPSGLDVTADPSILDKTGGPVSLPPTVGEVNAAGVRPSVALLNATETESEEHLPEVSVTGPAPSLTTLDPDNSSTDNRADVEDNSESGDFEDEDEDEDEDDDSSESTSADDEESEDEVVDDSEVDEDADLDSSATVSVVVSPVPAPTKAHLPPSVNVTSLAAAIKGVAESLKANPTAASAWKDGILQAASALPTPDVAHILPLILGPGPVIPSGVTVKWPGPWNLHSLPTSTIAPVSQIPSVQGTSIPTPSTLLSVTVPGLPSVPPLPTGSVVAPPVVTPRLAALKDAALRRAAVAQDRQEGVQRK